MFYNESCAQACFSLPLLTNVWTSVILPDHHNMCSLSHLIWLHRQTALLPTVPEILWLAFSHFAPHCVPIYCYSTHTVQSIKVQLDQGEMRSVKTGRGITTRMLSPFPHKPRKTADKHNLTYTIQMSLFWTVTISAEATVTQIDSLC
jgi:hypothetical protein